MWSVFFVFLSYLDGEFVKADFLSSSLEAEKESKEFFYLLNNTLCAKRSNVGEYHLLQVSDGIEEVRSVHDATGKLVDCALTTDQIQVKSFMHLCNLGLRGQVTVPVALNPSFKNITDVKLKCLQLKSKRVSADTSELQTSEARESRGKVDASVLRRSKRGFTYPGTLWCGAGNNADHYDQLGEFAETDKCCRVHDHCPHVIHAFSSNYGYTNFKWHSISHCDCDNAMKACLRNVNDTSSRVVGQAFFNVIEVPCFEFSYEEQCVDRHWYGVCKRYGKVPVAVIKESIPYDFGGIDVIDELPLPPLEKTASSQEPGSEPGETTEGTGTTQSTASTSASGSQTTTPEAPSLTNVVTAAEDFIKVLATVSSSQSSSPDAAKEEAQGSEKKRKKNAGGKKRKNKNRRGRGKGRKRKLNVETVVKTNEGAVGAPSCHVVEEVPSRTNIIEDPVRGRHSEASVDNFMRSEMSQEAREELSNAMMRDDPQRSAGVTPTNTPQESEEREEHKDKKDSKVDSASSTRRPLTTPSVTLSIVKTTDSEVSTFSATKPPTPTVTVSILKTKTRRERVRQGHVRQRPGLRVHTTPVTPKPHEEGTEEDQSITVSDRDSGEDTAAAVESGADAAGQLRSSMLGNANDKGPVATTAGAPTVTISSLRAERRRSKERGGRKRAGKVIPPYEPTGPRHRTDSEPARETPLVSTTEASTLGYHVVPARLDYLSVARQVPPTIRSRTDSSRKGRRQRLKESRRIMSRIFGTTFTPTSTSLAPLRYVVDKVDYDMITSPGVGTTAATTTTTLPPLQAGTSTLVQLGPRIKDTSAQDAPLLVLTEIPPSGTEKPKRKKQERREGKRRKKAMAV